VQLRYIVLAGIITPDHDTICTFRRRNELAIAACFLEVLKLAGS
jgi:transposase